MVQVKVHIDFLVVVLVVFVWGGWEIKRKVGCRGRERGKGGKGGKPSALLCALGGTLHLQAHDQLVWSLIAST